jgi:hypothetical protein
MLVTGIITNSPLDPDKRLIRKLSNSFRLSDSPGVDPKSTGRPEGTRSHESFSLVSSYSSVSKPRGGAKQ